jgi:hypothetical protein
MIFVRRYSIRCENLELRKELPQYLCYIAQVSAFDAD